MLSLKEEEGIQSGRCVWRRRKRGKEDRLVGR
jgi:hypothetical protein